MAGKASRRRKAPRSRGNGVPVEYRALGEAYHDACYAVFLNQIERILDRDPQARARLDRLIQEFRETVLSKIKL